MAHKNSVRLHAEYKPMLSMLNVVLDFSECLELVYEVNADADSFFVEVEVDSITVQFRKSSCSFYLKLLQLLPTSCRGLRWCCPSELHLSLQAKLTQEIVQGNRIHLENGVITHIEEEPSMNNQDLMVQKIKQCENRCYCAGCGRPIFTSKGSFKRVLPLPTENWSDFADIWFCHNHGHSLDAGPAVKPASAPGPVRQQDYSAQAEPDSVDPNHGEKQQQSKGLQPRPGDCLVSSLYMLVDSSRVCRTTVGITPQTQRLVCLRCGNFIGFVKKQKGVLENKNVPQESSDGDLASTEEVFKIYLHAVKFLSPETFVSWKPDEAGLPFDGISQHSIHRVSEGLVEDFLCQLLKDQSRLFTSFRFIVHSSHEEHADNGSIVLLLWLLDQNLQIFSTSCGILGPSAKTEVNVTKVLKLLYKGTFLQRGTIIKDCLQGSVYKMWERDNTVHSIDVPYPLCKQLLSLLITSTKQLPLSQRSLNSFHVGYLKYRPLAPVTG